MPIPSFISKRKYFTPQNITILLLCFGYFIDFYDLTILSTTYTSLIPQQFNITKQLDIQRLYLYITNWTTAGTLIGAIIWGVLGDKLGRSQVIKYSIIFYSIANILTIFTHSIILFCLLRFITGVGLTAEFAISNILITELLKDKQANFSAAILYIFGILGGVTATFLSFSHWQISFLFGGIVGILLYLARGNLLDSKLFNQLKQENHTRGNLISLINSPAKIVKLLKLSSGIFPYQLAITAMFIFPSFMNLHTQLSNAIEIILIGFFSGNLVSTYLSYHIISYFKNYPKYLIINIILLGLSLISFTYIGQRPEDLLIYAIIIGIFTGGYPVIWMQSVTRDFGTNVRSTATNLVSTMGNASKILINIILGYSLAIPSHTIYDIKLLIIIVISISILALVVTNNTYHARLDYIQE